ncbi:MAG: hypothetical protein A3F10_06390 [Coxiella sp. RIFCSPHIGHO2_12_FULL_42_15]|nr:MAG: hypothetical protein A3F10_06390 [Coxiella sp. RIFCSPHIGHO2_12_FULL_42_15]
MIEINSISFSLTEEKSILDCLKKVGIVIIRSALKKDDINLYFSISRNFRAYLLQQTEQTSCHDQDKDYRSIVLKILRMQSGYSLSYQMQYYFDIPNKFYLPFFLVQKAGLLKMISQYLHGPAGILTNYCSLRVQNPGEVQKALPFHQDAGPVNSSNGRGIVIWIPLNEIDAVTPTLEIVPQKINHIFPHVGQKETGYSILDDESNSIIKNYEGRLIFDNLQQGDVLLFDFTTLHRTYVTKKMTKARYSIDMRCVLPQDLPKYYQGDYLISKNVADSLNFSFEAELQYVVDKITAFEMAMKEGFMKVNDQLVECHSLIKKTSMLHWLRNQIRNIF